MLEPNTSPTLFGFHENLSDNPDVIISNKFSSYISKRQMNKQEIIKMLKYSSPKKSK